MIFTTELHHEMGTMERDNTSPLLTPGDINDGLCAWIVDIRASDGMASENSHSYRVDKLGQKRARSFPRKHSKLRLLFGGFGVITATRHQFEILTGLDISQSLIHSRLKNYSEILHRVRSVLGAKYKNDSSSTGKSSWKTWWRHGMKTLSVLLVPC